LSIGVLGAGVGARGQQYRSADRRRAGNPVWQWFTDPTRRELTPEEDWPHLSASHVRDVRATYARRAGEPDVTSLVHDLLEHSAEFRALWERHEVAARRFDRKRLRHPEVGLLHLTCEALLTPEADLILLAYFPTEGTDAREKLELLRVIGTQAFGAPTPPGSTSTSALDLGADG